MLDGLDDDQRAAATAPRGPVCVLAGAGTGKTRTITHRIAHLVRTGHVAPGQVLAVTFTARAAGEMRTRLRALGVAGVQARTFHAAALRQLRYFWPRVVGGPQWQLVDGKLRIVGLAAGRARMGTDAATLRDLAGEIEWAKASLVTPAEYPAAVARLHRDVPGPAEQVAAVYAGYEEAKTAAELLDFDDLLLHVAAALEGHADIAQEFRDRYRCFVVDEYQDVTPLQQRVLDAWLGERDDLTVVGDANQTIYTFAGASPKHLLEFPRRFPEAVVVRLQRDYRSTPQVVGCANTLIAAARDRPAGTRLRLIGQRPAGPDPDFTEHDDEVAEAAAVATRIRRMVAEGVPPSEIAVLFRVNAQSETYEQALTEAGVPYQVRGGERFFQRPEIRRAMSVVRMAGRRFGCVWSTTSARCSRRSASPRIRPVVRRSGRSGSRCSRSSSWPRSSRASSRRPTCAASPPSSRPGPTRRTRPPSRASRSRRCTRRRGSSGMWCSWSGSSTARCRSSTPTATSTRSRRSAVCSTSASPGRGGRWCCPGRWRGSRAGRAAVAAAASSTAWCPSTTRRRGSPSANGVGPSRVAGSAVRR